MFNRLGFFISFIFLFFLTFNVNAENADTYAKINYGISNHANGVTAKVGTIVLDEEDEGFMFSFGRLIGTNWGVDFMYYDLGTSSIKVDAAETIQHDNNKLTYYVDTAGTITNDITGVGLGFILASETENSGLGTVNFYFKAGTHAWDKSGSTTLLLNDDGWNKSFYNEGWGAYGGIGVAADVNEQIAIDISYDMLGISNDVSFDNMATLLSAGLRMKF